GGTRSKVSFVEICVDGVHYGFVGGIKLFLANGRGDFILHLRQREGVAPLQFIELKAAWFRLYLGHLARLQRKNIGFHGGREAAAATTPGSQVSVERGWIQSQRVVCLLL